MLYSLAVLHSVAKLRSKLFLHLLATEVVGTKSAILMWPAGLTSLRHSHIRNFDRFAVNACRWLFEVQQQLVLLHCQSFGHADVKPANIVVVPNDPQAKKLSLDKLHDQIKSMVQQAMQQRGPTKAADHHETVSQPTATCNPTEKAPNMTARQLNTTNDTASRALRAASSQFHLANDNVFSIARWVAAWQRTLKQYEAGPEMERLYCLMSLQSKTSIHRITSACSSCCLLPSFIITSLTCTVKEKEADGK